MRYRVQRMPSDLIVTVVKDGARQKGQIVNVSQTGIAIRDLSGLSMGDIVEIETFTARYSAQVVRLADGQVGLRFARALSNGDLAVLRRSVGGATSWRHSGMSPRFREL